MDHLKGVNTLSKGSQGARDVRHTTNSKVYHTQTLHGTAIYAYDPPNHPNVSIYGIHGVFGIRSVTYQKHALRTRHLWIPIGRRNICSSMSTQSGVCACTNMQFKKKDTPEEGRMSVRNKTL